MLLFTKRMVIRRFRGRLCDLDHDSAAGSGFDGGVGVGYLVEGVSGGDAGAEAAVKQGFGEGAGCVGLDSGREVVASEQAQGGAFEAERPVGDGGVKVDVAGEVDPGYSVHALGCDIGDSLGKVGVVVAEGVVGAERRAQPC
jgi:hypothetical protein